MTPNLESLDMEKNVILVNGGFHLPLKMCDIFLFSVSHHHTFTIESSTVLLHVAPSDWDPTVASW